MYPGRDRHGVYVTEYEGADRVAVTCGSDPLVDCWCFKSGQFVGNSAERGAELRARPVQLQCVLLMP
jgi:hypothetical protein